MYCKMTASWPLPPGAYSNTLSEKLLQVPQARGDCPASIEIHSSLKENFLMTSHYIQPQLSRYFCEDSKTDFMFIS